MTKAQYLITGATGKTGMLVTEQLLAKDAKVRVLVRQHDEHSKRLDQLGAEVAVEDFYDLNSLKEAMTGIESVYFCYPALGDRLLQAATNVSIAAKEQGVIRVVDMSQISALQGAKSPLSYQHWQAEQVLDWADVGAVHIRPTLCGEDLFLFTGGKVKETGQVTLPFGQGRHVPIAAKDIAAVVVALLENPKRSAIPLPPLSEKKITRVLFATLCFSSHSRIAPIASSMQEIDATYSSRRLLRLGTRAGLP